MLSECTQPINVSIISIDCYLLCCLTFVYFHTQQFILVHLFAATKVVMDQCLSFFFWETGNCATSDDDEMLWNTWIWTYTCNRNRELWNVKKWHLKCQRQCQWFTFTMALYASQVWAEKIKRNGIGEKQKARETNEFGIDSIKSARCICLDFLWWISR